MVRNIHLGLKKQILYSTYWNMKLVVSNYATVIDIFYPIRPRKSKGKGNKTKKIN